MKRLLFLALLSFSLPAAAHALSGDEFAALLKDALAKNPDILAQTLESPEGQKVFAALLGRTFEKNPGLVLNVLERHTDTVFAAAQKGAALQKRKAFYSRWENDVKKPKNISLTDHAMRGENDAPVTIAVFSDFTCSYCKLASQTLSDLQEKMPGAFRYVFKPHPAKNNPAARQAAEWFVAASLRDPGKAWKLYEILYAGADALFDDPDAFLPKAAKEAGFDPALLASEAKGRRVADLLAADQEEADKLGVSGTPYLFVDDLVIPGAPDEGLLRESIERAAKAKNVRLP